MKSKLFRNTIIIMFSIFIVILSTFIYLTIDLKDNITFVSKDDKSTEKGKQSKFTTPADFHNTETHEHPHEPVNKLITETQEIGSTTPIPEAIDVDKLIASHPAFHPQAIADRKTVAEYHQKYKAYMKVYDEIQTEWWDIKKEMDVFNKMLEEEFHQKSETEKRQLAKKYVSLTQQWDKNKEKLTAHKKTEPIRPDAAFKRVAELEKTVPKTIPVNTED